MPPGRGARWSTASRSRTGTCAFSPWRISDCGLDFMSNPYHDSALGNPHATRRNPPSFFSQPQREVCRRFRHPEALRRLLGGAEDLELLEHARGAEDVLDVLRHPSEPDIAAEGLEPLFLLHEGRKDREVHVLDGLKVQDEAGHLALDELA